jgi:hypothetical protein
VRTCRWIQTFRWNMLPSPSALKIEALYSFEMLVPTDKSKRLYNPEDHHRHLHRRENLRSHQKSMFKVGVTWKLNFFLSMCVCNLNCDHCVFISIIQTLLKENNGMQRSASYSGDSRFLLSVQTPAIRRIVVFSLGFSKKNFGILA